MDYVELNQQSFLGFCSSPFSSTVPKQLAAGSCWLQGEEKGGCGAAFLASSQDRSVSIPEKTEGGEVRQTVVSQCLELVLWGFDQFTALDEGTTVIII